LVPRAKSMHQRSAHRSLLVVGSVALDDIDGPFGMHRDLLGGSASFISRAAAYFTKNVSVVAVIGDDFPMQHIEEMVTLGIDTSGIEKGKGEPCHWVGRYAPDLATRETIDSRLGVLAELRPTGGGTPRAAQPALPRPARPHTTHPQTTPPRPAVSAPSQPQVRDPPRDAQPVLLGTIAPALQLDVLTQLRAPALAAMHTMNLWINTKRDDLAKTLAKVHTL